MTATAARVREDDVVLLRAGSGTIHLGVRLGRVHDTFCCTVIDSPHVRTWTGEQATAYVEERARFVCDDCVTIADKPWRLVCRITGWNG